jgi:hypothetical protein
VRAVLRQAVAATDAESAAGNASAGRRSNSGQTDIIAVYEPFFVFGLPDEHGWRGELLTVHSGDAIVAAHYRETRPSEGGLAVKRGSERYETLYEQVDGRSFSEVAGAIEAALLQSQGAWSDGFSPADAATGATLTYAKATSLVDRIAGIRATPDLPRRICR